ncbi:hypothetical protein BT96DRAFT_1004926 [Gymnopus androsaceus JB14]|uniref:CxC2-like cysteine cluster KDZ transposase-associated domain-containing protein n=1 Tax=Gymnopus androsaceus JB14 TaxID=1447944 RepID=A0A6A4GR44_9AGAR|nr:hypothetical protein BT96DRAFT_1004926 [Gymnopus androsaceus JB14]
MSGLSKTFVVAYMDWVYLKKKQPERRRKPVEWMDLYMVNIFGDLGLVHDSSSLVLAGLMPTAPLSHKTAITTRTVALYHSLFVRCPKLGIQPFIKALCDAEGSPFKPYLATQMSAAFDLYVAILNHVRLRVQKALQCDGPNWRMLNCCPACQYRLKNEEQLEVRMLASCDGNDSLRRVERVDKAKVDDHADADGAPGLAPSKERLDRRVGGGDYFLQPAQVDAWDEGNWEFINEMQANGDQLTPEQHLWAEGQCEERWHNAKDKNTARSVGKFMECGWFAFLCRHMMLLLACDMIRSGEQSKYPLSILNHYMSAEKEEREATKEGRPLGKFAIAYDVHCKLSKTVKRSPLKALAEWSNYLPVIGTMHGYAHERACQLLFLMLYIVGTGIEDGETCERYFNVTNALASITRHQSVFHRRQAIAEFIYYHDNFETYSKSSLFILNNYKQALGILKEEGNYLRSLTKVPPVETLEMEYFMKLEGLDGCQARLREARETWRNYKFNQGRDQGPALKKRCWNEMENERKLIADCQVLKWKLEIKDRWVNGSDKWCSVKKMVKEATYRKALDKLEGLLVARMFEMTRLNVAGTGYKMRKHIATALKLRSKSIKTAITAYNEAAASMSPPRRRISWEEVVEFSYLSEFDILRDTREDVRERKWATQKNRVLMQEFFKLIRAENELPRLHLEICHLFTYMRDKEYRLKSISKDVEARDPALALQILLYWQERGRFNNLHRRRLLSIKRLDGFKFENNRYFSPGVAVAKEAPLSEVVDGPVLVGDAGSDVEEEDEEDEMDGEIDKVLSIAWGLAGGRVCLRVINGLTEAYSAIGHKRPIQVQDLVEDFCSYGVTKPFRAAGLYLVCEGDHIGKLVRRAWEYYGNNGELYKDPLWTIQVVSVVKENGKFVKTIMMDYLRFHLHGASLAEVHESREQRTSGNAAMTVLREQRDHVYTNGFWTDGDGVLRPPSLKLHHNGDLPVRDFVSRKRQSDLQFALALEPLSAMSLQRSKTARTHSSNTVLPYNQLGRKVIPVAQKRVAERTLATGNKSCQPLTMKSVYKPLSPLPLSIIPTPIAHSEDIWPDDPPYLNDRVDDALLPSWGYVSDLTTDTPAATDDYFRFLLRLARCRDPEVTNWVLRRMDFELEALARLPDADCPAFEGDYSPDRKELNIWLRMHDKDGLHAIHQNTIALLRSAIDDFPEYEILRYGQLFGDNLRIKHMESCMSLEASLRRQNHLAQRVRDAKEKNVVV